MTFWLRRISVTLVLTFGALSGADLICAWPCLSGEPTEEQNAATTPSHNCHSAPANSAPEAIAADAGPCGMDHGGPTLVAERISGRTSLPLDSIGRVAADSVNLHIGAHSGSVATTRGGPPLSDPPGRSTPLRI